MRITACSMVLAILALACSCPAQEFRPDIPRVWDDSAVKDFELPLVQRDRSPRYMSAEEYYKLKVRPIYRAYPVYAAGKEPPGYIEWLKQREPEVIFDASRLHTKEEWIASGKIVFEADVSFQPAKLNPGGAKVPPEFSKFVSKDGIVPGFVGGHYIIRQKGVVEKASTACASCHTRLMPDDTFVQGAQGNKPDGVLTDLPRRNPPDSHFLDFLWINYGVPWIQPREEFERSMTAVAHADQYAGVLSREGTSVAHPPHIPSLIGVQEIKYLDATGLVRHRSIGDLMRYAVINMGLDNLAHYGEFQPTKSQGNGFGGEDGTRYSDEQLYALALYVYSLRPPPNPNPSDDLARRGEQIFKREGCAGCHTPPLYTSNKLTPATGFKIPDDFRKTENILNVSVGTDPVLAIETRRGTGFYKVPSLRGVWFRNGFGHSGNADTLEEWLDPARLRADYVAKGYHRGPGPILGHEFGLQLSPEDKHALIAFLKTL